MKKITIFGLLALIVSSKSIQAQEKASWKELDSFHVVIANTFHPAEEGKFEPIRSRSSEMLEKAKAWEKSSVPDGYNKIVKKSLKYLVKSAKEINKMVGEKASDEALKEKLSELHDMFHQIMEKCEKPN
jgi:hypothetical protein